MMNRTAIIQVFAFCVTMLNGVLLRAEPSIQHECILTNHERYAVALAFDKFRRIKVDPFKIHKGIRGGGDIVREADRIDEDELNKAVERCNVIRDVGELLLSCPQCASREIQRFRNFMKLERGGRPFPDPKKLSPGKLPDYHLQLIATLNQMEEVLEARKLGHPGISDLPKNSFTFAQYLVYEDQENSFTKDPVKRRFYVKPEFKVAGIDTQEGDAGYTRIRLKLKSSSEEARIQYKEYARDLPNNGSRQIAEEKTRGIWSMLKAVQIRLVYGDRNHPKHKTPEILGDGEHSEYLFEIKNSDLVRNEPPNVSYGWDAFYDGKLRRTFDTSIDLMAGYSL